MDKANIIDEIYNFKNVEFSPDEINHKIEILNFQNSRFSKCWVLKILGLKLQGSKNQFF